MNRILIALARSVFVHVALILLVVWLLTGCATAPEPARVLRVNVPIPVACQEPVPAKPVLPVDSLPASADLDRFVQAAIATIERLTGYSGQLETALDNCRAPIPEGKP